MWDATATKTVRSSVRDWQSPVFWIMCQRSLSSLTLLFSLQAPGNLWAESSLFTAVSELASFSSSCLSSPALLYSDLTLWCVPTQWYQPSVNTLTGIWVTTTLKLELSGPLPGFGWLFSSASAFAVAPAELQNSIDYNNNESRPHDERLRMASQWLTDHCDEKNAR